VPRKQIQNLGLVNVNDWFKGFTWGWLTNSSKWKSGKVPKDLSFYKLRSKCDYCYPFAELRIIFPRSKAP
jgi:hypothetical protein